MARQGPLEISTFYIAKPRAFPINQPDDNITMPKFEYLSIEKGRGCTYVQKGPGVTVYGHGTYPGNSVLAGQPSRNYLKVFDSLPTEEENISAANKWAKETYPEISCEEFLGTSYIPIEEMVAHLPDEGDGW